MMKNYLKEYGEAVLSGEIVACEKIKRQYEKLLHDMEIPKQWHFDVKAGSKPIEFIESFCKQSQGKIGSKMELQLFQKAMLQAAFGFLDDNDLRRYQEMFDLMGRKNGKTTLLAALELYMLMADGEGAPECYIIATARDQANKGYTEAVNMYRHSPEISALLKKRQSDLYFKYNMGFLKALASNVNSLDGLNSHFVTIDELAAIKNRDIYDLMKQSMAARKQPLLCCITTSGFIRNSIYDSQYEYAARVIDGKIENERFLPLMYELDSYDEWTNPKMWVKANPGLGTIKKTEFLADSVAKAKDDDTFLTTVLTKDFNIIANATTAWLPYDVLNNDELIPGSLKFRYGIGGFDAADSVDLNAAKMICKRRDSSKIYVKQMYWMPQSKLDDMGTQGASRDRAPYDVWRARGLLRVEEGNRVNKRVILDWFIEMRDKYDIYPLYIGFDPWHIDDSLLAAFEQEFGKTVMIPVRQGVATLSQPMKELKAEFAAHNIVYNNNPIDKYCLANTYTKTDINGNIQPDKGSSETLRIDGTAALLDAYVIYINKADEYESLL